MPVFYVRIRPTVFHAHSMVHKATTEFSSFIFMSVTLTANLVSTRQLATMTATRVMTALPPHLRSRVPPIVPPVEQFAGSSESEPSRDYTTPRLSGRRLWGSPDDTTSRNSTEGAWEQDRSIGSRNRMTETELYE